jgi:flavin reductase (DIM6/NTAB) family NADH-FMN oxidoreductase RutF
MKFDPEGMESRAIHELLVGCVTPRPIAFVSTIGENGVYNLAPFSFFTIMALHPALAGFSVGRRRNGAKKDTLVNIEFSGDFVINIVTEAISRPMNQAAGDYPIHVDEFKEAGLTPVASDLVRPPRVAESPIQLECRLMQVMEFGVFPHVHNFVVGQILRVHVQDDMIVDTVIRAERVKTIGRLGADLYCRTQEIFEMKRPFVSSGS